MHERGWLGVSDSEDEQPLCASTAHKQGRAVVDELGDLSMDDTGWQDVALQEDGAVSNEEAALVQAAAQAAEPQGGHYRSCPWKMFGLLVDSRKEQEIILDCKHMMDPWSRELVAKCRREGLRLNDPTARSTIASVEREIRRETAQIEARHASIRRELVGLSVQTHTALFAHVSAGRETQEVRRMSEHVRPGQKPPSLHKDRNSRSVKGQPQRQETRGKRSSEVQPLAKLGQRYRELGEEE